MIDKMRNQERKYLVINNIHEVLGWLKDVFLSYCKINEVGRWFGCYL